MYIAEDKSSEDETTVYKPEKKKKSNLLSQATKSKGYKEKNVDRVDDSVVDGYKSSRTGVSFLPL